MNEIYPRTDRSPVAKALRLLAFVAANKGAVALAELSRALKLPKATVYRLARVVENAGFVHKDPLTRRYRVALAFEDLALSALRNGCGHTARQLLMNRLAEQLGAQVNLVVLKAGNLFCVEWVESTAPLRVDIRSAAPVAVHCSASGKLLLAFGSDEVRQHVLRSAPFVAHTKNTITSSRELARELNRICARGFAEDDQELLAGVNCLAVPIFNRANEVVAGLAVMAPSATLPLPKLRAFLPDIRKCADSISSELGRQPVAIAKAESSAAVRHRGNGRARRPGVKRKDASGKLVIRRPRATLSARGRQT